MGPCKTEHQLLTNKTALVYIKRLNMKKTDNVLIRDGKIFVECKESPNKCKINGSSKLLCYPCFSKKIKINEKNYTEYKENFNIPMLTKSIWDKNSDRRSTTTELFHNNVYHRQKKRQQFESNHHITRGFLKSKLDFLAYFSLKPSSSNVFTRGKENGKENGKMLIFPSDIKDCRIVIKRLSTNEIKKQNVGSYLKDCKVELKRLAAKSTKIS